MNFQPYQEATEATINQSHEPGQALKKLASVGGAVAGGSVILKRLMPFLNQYIPSGLAAKGISKIEPRLGKFIQGAEKHGSSAEEALEFIKSKFGEEEEEAAAQDPFLELSNYDPKLAEGIRGMIEKGWTPDKSNEIVHLKYGAFAKPIAQMEKDKGKSFINILKELFGKGKQGKAALQPQQEQMQAPQGQPQGQQQPQGGGGDQALMAAFQKIMQM